MSLYVTDTHPLIWYASGKHRLLSRRALDAFDTGTRGRGLIYVPPFVLWEIAMLVRVRRVALRTPFDDWAERLVAHPGFELAEVGVKVLTRAFTYPFGDPFDSVIVATASVLGLPLITRDMGISQSGLARVHW